MYVRSRVLGQAALGSKAQRAYRGAPVSANRRLRCVAPLPSMQKVGIAGVSSERGGLSKSQHDAERLLCISRRVSSRNKT